MSSGSSVSGTVWHWVRKAPWLLARWLLAAPVGSLGATVMAAAFSSVVYASDDHSPRDPFWPLIGVLILIVLGLGAIVVAGALFATRNDDWKSRRQPLSAIAAILIAAITTMVTAGVAVQLENWLLFIPPSVMTLIGAGLVGLAAFLGRGMWGAAAKAIKAAYQAAVVHRNSSAAGGPADSTP